MLLDYYNLIYRLSIESLFIIDDELVNGDLGEIVIRDEKEIFVPKSQIKNYTEE